MQNTNRKKSTKLVVAFLVASCLLITGGLLATLATISEAATKPEEVIYQCSASGRNRLYVVDQLKKDGANFDLAIYKFDRSHPLYKDQSWPTEGDYLETATLTANIDQDSALTATGKSSKGMIVVEAFGRTKRFNVKEDEVQAAALGQCDRFWQMASSQARRKIRECLGAVARDNGGNIAEIERYRCMYSDR
ncbi:MULTISPECIES: hypothetical protein [unclassified Microcoleus]|uniref:hypothetical protein n=1 Tax=unclassified Microcoleus TaxID=2642155 RepID=UPI002FD0BD0B